MKILTVNKMNEIECYGKKISIIDTYKGSCFIRNCCYYYKGLFHIFIKSNGEPIKYRTTKKW